MDEWVNKLRYAHEMGTYWVIKSNEGLIYTTIWIDAENTLLSEKKPHAECHILNGPIYMNYPEEINP